MVGGNSEHTVQFNLSDLAKNEQTIIGVRKGTKEELLQLLDLVSTNMVSPSVDVTISLHFSTHTLDYARAQMKHTDEPHR